MVASRGAAMTRRSKGSRAIGWRPAASTPLQNRRAYMARKDERRRRRREAGVEVRADYAEALMRGRRSKTIRNASTRLPR